MKLPIILILVICAYAYAEDFPKEEKAEPMQLDWEARYGQYGINSIIPIEYQYRSPYSLTYPYGYSGYPGYLGYPRYYGYPGLQSRLAYPLPTSASYDPDYFYRLYGYYPENK